MERASERASERERERERYLIAQALYLALKDLKQNGYGGRSK